MKARNAAIPLDNIENSVATRQEGNASNNEKGNEGLIVIVFKVQESSQEEGDAEQEHGERDNGSPPWEVRSDRAIRCSLE